MFVRVLSSTVIDDKAGWTMISIIRCSWYEILSVTILLKKSKAVFRTASATIEVQKNFNVRFGLYVAF